MRYGHTVVIMTRILGYGNLQLSGSEADEASGSVGFRVHEHFRILLRGECLLVPTPDPGL